MKIFLWIISGIWIIVGIVGVMLPAGLKRFYSIFKPVRWISIFPLIGGLLLLWAAPASSLSWFMRVLGIIGLIKGLFLLLCPVSMVKATLDGWLNQSLRTYRLTGILILLLAELVILSIL